MAEHIDAHTARQKALQTLMQLTEVADDNRYIPAKVRLAAARELLDYATVELAEPHPGRSAPRDSNRTDTEERET